MSLHLEALASATRHIQDLPKRILGKVTRHHSKRANKNSCNLFVCALF